MRVILEAPSIRHKNEFLSAVRRSRRLHGSFVSPPSTPQAFGAMMKRYRSARNVGYFVCLSSGELTGVINLNEIVKGLFQSAYLGYYAFAPYDRRGHMREGMSLVIGRVFGELGLHRIEANIQPNNVASRALVEGLGFRLEGFSPRYLKINGRWRDHERWALTAEEWRPRARGRHTQQKHAGEAQLRRGGRGAPRR
jgi:ribosomal-protein-alanine N-acetyltransferase